jgi:hypothetical protein
MVEYKKNYPGEKWELIRTAKMLPGDNIRVYFKRESENTLRTAVCAKTREKDWVCEVGQNFPEGLAGPEIICLSRTAR